MSTGQRLRAVREKLGFTLKDVEQASLEIARHHQNSKYWIPQSRLSNIESREMTPNIYRLHALALIYGRSVVELLEWFGIGGSQDRAAHNAPRTHLIGQSGVSTCEIPLRLDPLFRETNTCYIRRMIQEWGSQPMAALHALQHREFTYGYVGTEDYSLYPLILPGAFVQIDPRLTEIESGPWASDLERPVYFLETHETYLCGWCSVLNSREIQVQPHPLSGLAARNYKRPSEIEVVGRVVGMATKLRSFTRDVEPELAATRITT